MESGDQELPTSFDEFTCFGLAVSYPDREGSSCYLLDGNLSSIDQIFGAVEDGGTLQAAVYSGEQRKLEVFAFSTLDGSCPESITSLSKAQMTASSPPQLIGGTTLDIEGESMDVTINVSMSNAVPMNHCQGGGLAWEESAPASTQFSVADGYLTMTGDNLGSVTSAKLVSQSGAETSLAVMSKNIGSLALKSLKALNLVSGALYSLFISNAYGQEVFSISVGGSGGYTVSTISSDYSILSTESNYLFLVDSGDTTLTLPAAADAGAGFTVVVKNIGTNNGLDIVRVASQTGEKIDVSYENLFLESTLSTVTLTTDGTNWWMLSSNGSIEPQESFSSCDPDGASNCHDLLTSDSDDGWYLVNTGAGEFYECRYNSSYSRGACSLDGATSSTDNKYLIYDPTATNSYTTALYYWVANEWDTFILGTTGSDYFGRSYYDQYSGMMNSYFNSYYSHAGASDTAYINNQLSSSDYGPCITYGGRLAQSDDSITFSSSSGYSYWTSSATANIDEYDVLVDDNTTTTGDGSTDSYYYLCVWSVSALGLQ